MNNNSLQFEYTLTNLDMDQDYKIKIRAEGKYQECSSNNLVGTYSDAVILATNATCKVYKFPH